MFFCGETVERWNGEAVEQRIDRTMKVVMYDDAMKTRSEDNDAVAALR